MPVQKIRPPRVVLRPISGPDQIADVWMEVAPPQDLDTPWGKFKFLRAGQRYVMYLEVKPEEVTAS